MDVPKSSFEQTIREKGVLVYPFRGISMRPMLRQETDTVIIRAYPQGQRPQKYDVILFRARSGKYVMHRVVRLRERDLTTRGDNLYRDETGIEDDQILGVLTGFVRNQKQISVLTPRYRLYGRFWVAVYPLRKALHTLKGFLTEGLWVHLRLKREKKKDNAGS